MYLAILGQELYGQWLAAASFLGIIAVVDPGLGSVVQQKVVVTLKQNVPGSLFQLIFESIRLTVIYTIPIILVGTVITFSLEHILGLNKDLFWLEDLRRAYLYGIVGTALIFVSHTLVGINQGLMNSLGAGLAFFISNITSALWIYLRLGNSGVLVLGEAFIVRGFLMVLLNSLAIIYRVINLSGTVHSNKEIRNDLVKSVGYNFLGRLSTISVTQMPTILLARYTGSETVVSYKVLMTLFDLLKMILIRPSLAIQSAIADFYVRKDKIYVERFVQKYFLLLLSSVLLVLPLSLIAAPVIIHFWVSLDFFVSHLFTLLVALSAVLSVFTQTILNFHFSFGAIKDTALLNFRYGMLCIIMLVLTIPKYGVIGAPTSFVISEIILLLMISYKFKKSLDLKYYELRSLCKPKVLSFVLLMVVITVYLDYVGLNFLDLALLPRYLGALMLLLFSILGLNWFQNLKGILYER